jgi:hypothetical protein
MRPHLRAFMPGTTARVRAHHGGEVHLDVAVPDLVGDLIDGLRVVDAGVVDEDVDLAEPLLGFDGQGFDGGTVRHVGHHPFDFHAQAFADLRGGGFEFIGVAAGDEDIRARLGETACHRLAKTFAAAGDESCFAREIEEG